MQLQNASCLFWIKETSKDIGSKLVKTLSETHSYGMSNGKPAGTKIFKLRPTALYPLFTGPLLYTLQDKQEDEVMYLFKRGQYAEMYQMIKKRKAQGDPVSAATLNTLVEHEKRQAGKITTHGIYQSPIEAPTPRGAKRLGHLLNIYTFHKPCILDRNFLNNYMWLCYHQDNLETLQLLLYKYLRLPLYDSRALSYAVNAYVINYDVEFAKCLLQSIVGMNKPLDNVLLHTVLTGFARVGARFENYNEVFSCWSQSQNTEAACEKSMALLLDQHLKYGKPDEIGRLESEISRMGLSHNHLIRMVRNQNSIEGSGLRQISIAQLTETLEIRNSAPDLAAFDSAYLDFFARRSDLQMVQLLLQEMKTDGVALTSADFGHLAKYFAREGKFLPLLEFLSKLLSLLSFDVTFVKHLFAAFLRAYPYEGDAFRQRLHDWIDGSQLLHLEKTELKESCQVVKVESSLNPFMMRRNALDNTKKYESPQWACIAHKRSITARSRTKDQALFRVDQGIRDVLRKGVKPDFSVLESTLRRLKPATRQMILHLVDELRMGKYKKRLEIVDFTLSNPTKQSLEAFVRERMPTFSTSDRIFMARRAFNFCLYDLAIELLQGVDEHDMNSQRSMLAFNWMLRSEIGRGNFKGCCEAIDAFAIDDVTLSPYIHTQCRYIEKSLGKRIRTLKRDVSDAEAALGKLHGLIGDIEVRLARDREDVYRKVTEMFITLDGWVARRAAHL